MSLKSAGFELVQYDQCLFTTSGSRYQSEASQSVVVCLWISEECGVIMMHAEEKKAFNGKDMARQFRRLREVLGQERMVAAFGDQASINRAKVMREACAEPDVERRHQAVVQRHLSARPARHRLLVQSRQAPAQGEDHRPQEEWDAHRQLGSRPGVSRQLQQRFGLAGRSAWLAQTS